jgi:Fur family ferric uptake transcriptional regulator
MSEKMKYKTKQREEVLTYLKTVPGQHVTVADIVRYMRDKGSSVGTTTVYRQIERLVDEGVVMKYIVDANSPACFVYTPENNVAVGEPCFHCKCESCGKLIHLHCEEIAMIQGHLRAEHGFVLDPKRTVFYGTCDACAALEER